MNRKINYLPLILSLIIVNSAGFFLKYFELDTYLIFIGFRFHLSFVLPFIFCYLSGLNTEIKNYFVQSKLNRWFSMLLAILIPFIIILISGYFLFNLKIGDPDYFYEFGLSSIFDLPVYFLWNFPQLAALYVLIKYYSADKPVFLKSFIYLVLLFLYEVIPIELSGINYSSLFSLVLASAIGALMISKFTNIYFFALIIFAIIWLNLLAFGSESQPMINILFANNYSSWEGFFSVSRYVAGYVLPVQLLLTFVVLYLRSKFNDDLKV